MPNFSIQAPDGKTYDIEGPDQTGALDALKKHLGVPPAPKGVLGVAAGAQQMSEGAGINPATDLLKSAATGVAYNAPTELAGSVGDVESAGRTVINAVSKLFGKGQAVDPKSFFPTGQDFRDFIEAPGDQGLGFQPHKAETDLGKAAENVGGFVGGAALGGVPGLVRGGAEALPAFMAQIARFGLAPGIVSEEAGQATKGTALEGPARLAGGLVAGGIASTGRTGGQAAPELAQIAQARDAAFGEARRMGLAFRPNVVQYGFSRLADRLRRDGFVDPDLTPRASAVLRRLEREAASGQPMTLEQIDRTRRFANDQFTNVDPAERRAGAEIVAGIDDFATRASASPHAIVGGNPRAVQVMQQARELASTWFRADVIHQAFHQAELNAGRASSAGAKQTALVNEFAKIARSPARMRGFTPEQQGLIERTVRGGGIENALTLLSSIHGPFDVGSMLRWMRPVANAMTRRRAGDVDTVVRGGTLGQANLPTAVAGQVGGQLPSKDAPVQGAQKAADGNWYVPDTGRAGKYLQVSP